MSPSAGPFLTGDTIKVFGSSKHWGRTATIIKVGRRRLTVEFHDKQGGHYVGLRDAHLLNPESVDSTIDDAASPTAVSPAASATTTQMEPHVNKTLTEVLEQLSITTATVIKTYDLGERTALFHAFTHSLDQHIGGTTRRNTSVTMPTYRNTYTSYR
jgi:hypothetical protein